MSGNTPFVTSQQISSLDRYLQNLSTNNQLIFVFQHGILYEQKSSPLGKIGRFSTSLFVDSKQSQDSEQNELQRLLELKKTRDSQPTLNRRNFPPALHFPFADELPINKTFFIHILSEEDQQIDGIHLVFFNADNKKTSNISKVMNRVIISDDGHIPSTITEHFISESFINPKQAQQIVQQTKNQTRISTDIFMSPQSHLTFTKVQIEDQSNSFHESSIRIYSLYTETELATIGTTGKQIQKKVEDNQVDEEVKKRSKKGSITVACLSLGSAQSTEKVSLFLQTPDIEAKTIGLCLCEKEQMGSVEVNMHHICPSCESSQLQRNILCSSQSRTKYRGGIFVHRTAPQTVANQLVNSLLLGQSTDEQDIIQQKDANKKQKRYGEAEATPLLVIENDDVVCNHGSTCGDVDNTPLLFMRQRGIDEFEARSMLVKSFANEALVKILSPYEDARVRTEKELQTTDSSRNSTPRPTQAQILASQIDSPIKINFQQIASPQYISPGRGLSPTPLVSSIHQKKIFGSPSSVSSVDINFLFPQLQESSNQQENKNGRGLILHVHHSFAEFLSSLFFKFFDAIVERHIAEEQKRINKRNEQDKQMNQTQEREENINLNQKQAQSEDNRRNDLQQRNITQLNNNITLPTYVSHSSSQINTHAPLSQLSIGYFDVEQIRKDFPIFDESYMGNKLWSFNSSEQYQLLPYAQIITNIHPATRKPIIYFDNSATTQRPLYVLRAIDEYYLTSNSNVHRGAHLLAERSNSMYDRARNIIAQFIGTKEDGEIVFTKGTTEAINLVAYSFLLPRMKLRYERRQKLKQKKYIESEIRRRLLEEQRKTSVINSTLPNSNIIEQQQQQNEKEGNDDEDSDIIITTQLEHHANIVPWQIVASQFGGRLHVLPLIKDSGGVDFSTFESTLSQYNGQYQQEKINKDSLIDDEQYNEEDSDEIKAKKLKGKVVMIAITHCSNVTGRYLPIKEVCQIANKYRVPILIDGAQGIIHLPNPDKFIEQNKQNEQLLKGKDNQNTNQNKLKQVDNKQIDQQYQSWLDVQNLGCSFYCFSGHKLFGPNGIGVLYGRMDILEVMQPFQGGGDMIESVSFEKTTYTLPPQRFEAGTPNVPGAIGLAAAIEYITKRVGLNKIEQYEQRLLHYALKMLRKVEGVKILGHSGDFDEDDTLKVKKENEFTETNWRLGLKTKKIESGIIIKKKENQQEIKSQQQSQFKNIEPIKYSAPIISFVVKDMHAHDMGTLLDSYGIATRGGHHCAMPLAVAYGISASSRASFAFYNTLHEIDLFVGAVRRAIVAFREAQRANSIGEYKNENESTLAWSANADATGVLGPLSKKKGTQGLGIQQSQTQHLSSLSNSQQQSNSITPSTSELYQELIIEHGTHPRNSRIISLSQQEKDQNQFVLLSADGFNSMCGDKVTIYVKLSLMKDEITNQFTSQIKQEEKQQENNLLQTNSTSISQQSDTFTLNNQQQNINYNLTPIIQDISFQGQGCAISQASTSFMTELILNKTIEQVSELFSLFHKLITTGEQKNQNQNGNNNNDQKEFKIFSINNNNNDNPNIKQNNTVSENEKVQIHDDEDDECCFGGLQSFSRNEQINKNKVDQKQTEFIQQQLIGLGKVNEIFGNVYKFPQRVKCASLAWHTLMKALSPYLNELNSYKQRNHQSSDQTSYQSSSDVSAFTQLHFQQQTMIEARSDKPLWSKIDQTRKQ